MSLRSRMIFAILFCVTVATACVGVPLFLGAHRLAQEGAAREMAQLWGRADSVKEARLETARSFTAMVASMPRVQRAVDKADDKGILRLFSKDFEAFSQQTGITHFHFHSPDATSILRVHDPARNGDDLSASRPLVVAANKDRVPLAGVESGPDGLTLRAIHPVGDEDDHAGTVEVGLPLDAAFLGAMIAGTDAAIEVYTQTADGAGFTHLSAGYDGAAILTDSEITDAFAHESERVNRSLDGAPYTTEFHILNDFSGAPVALVHLLLPQANYIAIEQRIATVAGAAAVVALLIGAVLAWVIGRRLTARLGQVIERMHRLAEGDTDQDFNDLKGSGPEVTEMAEGLEVFRDGLLEVDRMRAEDNRRQAEQEQVVGRLADGLRAVARGDLDSHIDDDFGAGYSGLIADYNAAVEQLSGIIAEIAQSSQSVNAAAGQIGAAAEDLSNRTETSAANLEQTSAALQEITNAVQESTRGARKADASGRSAIDKARAGSEVVTSAVDAIKEVEQSSDEIAQIIGMIDDIAFQTNLLALNAGVEAARAGEAGSGFAVVAAEVRALAARTAESAQQIGGLIDASGEKVEHGVRLVSQTGDALTDIVTAIEDVTRQIARIAELAEEQESNLSEVNTAVSHLDHTTQQNAGMFSETTEAAASLSREGEHLAALVMRFTQAKQRTQDTTKVTDEDGDSDQFAAVG